MEIVKIRAKGLPKALCELKVPRECEECKSGALKEPSDDEKDGEAAASDGIAKDMADNWPSMMSTDWFHQE
eukprot:6485767-Amphidinium_carterae.2